MLPKVILGSQSTQRKIILSHFKIPFSSAVSHFDETSIPSHDDIGDYAIRISEGKSSSLQQRLSEDCLIITADTLVYQEGEFFHKPKNDDEAVWMLQRLASKPHSVVTGVTINFNSKMISAYEITDLILHNVEEKYLKKYVQAFQTTDKCGGYSIQNGGNLIIKEIKGCSYNVQGLPINTLYRLLLQFGIDLWDFIL